MVHYNYLKCFYHRRQPLLLGSPILTSPTQIMLNAYFTYSFLDIFGQERHQSIMRRTIMMMTMIMMTTMIRSMR